MTTALQDQGIYHLKSTKLIVNVTSTDQTCCESSVIRDTYDICCC